MKAIATLCSIAALALFLTACNPAPPTAPPDTHDADVKAVGDLEAQANKDWAAKDADKIIGFYTDDALLITPGSDPLHGREAIHAALKQMVIDPALSLTFHSDHVEVAKSGDLAYTEGPYELTVHDPTTNTVIHDHGNYVTTFRKQPDGSWKASVDISTSAVPPAPPAKKH
ncbi:MAG TPA: SgcJ/EcaC family oxidoreductase [Terracidiphilus sp.]|jgi:uncharacterized protein (TIGR02246 family)|nr:SgcJ/EcaC family oxidoreductase [Terracidiphilus sp.]